MPVIYDLEKFPNKVKKTIRFIMEKEKPANIPMKYDDLTINASIRITKNIKTKSNILGSINDHITIKHNPSNCKISMEFYANDLHNSLLLMLNELGKLVDENEKGKLNNG